jgi:2-dehydro-3-deoxygluconokinase
MRFVTIGECMMELRQAGDGRLTPGFAGDALNSAFYARRTLPSNWTVEFLTAFGIDRISQDMRANIEDMGIETSGSPTIPDRQSGLYMIHLDKGERSFSYWRSHSAARLLARDRNRFCEALSLAKVVLFSGITLAILEGDDAEFMLEHMSELRQAGVTVAFDPNIRPNLWPDKARMRDLIGRAAHVVSLVLPSYDDEAKHFGDADVAATLRRYRDCGASLVVVKNGSGAVRLSAPELDIAVPARAVPDLVDSTGAGDSFNGIFLARLALGDSPRDAARHAVRGASVVIQRHGALVRDFKNHETSKAACENG